MQENLPECPLITTTLLVAEEGPGTDSPTDGECGPIVVASYSNSTAGTFVGIVGMAPLLNRGTDTLLLPQGWWWRQVPALAVRLLALEAQMDAMERRPTEAGECSWPLWRSLFLLPGVLPPPRGWGPHQTVKPVQLKMSSP